MHILTIVALLCCVGRGLCTQDWRDMNKLEMHGGVPMGIINPDCDNAKMRLDVDWDDSKDDEYVCRSTVIKTQQSESVKICSSIKRPLHICMNETIKYRTRVPMSGPHRPLWPKYGEYVYLPPQRWLHSLEHGAIAMLYHPCADKNDVDKLRKLVTGCLYRHVITPYRKLTENKPLALVAWGCRLEMSYYDEEKARNFILEYAKAGPEKTSVNGQYDLDIVSHAVPVCGYNDRNVCLADPNISCQ